MKKIRIDSFLVENGYSASREKAKRDLLSGWVKVNGETVRDPSRRIEGNESVAVERPGGVFVSRGGEKLQRALAVFQIHLKGKTAVDLGASTGGFTDCMLRAGARKVYAVDVGYGQLDYSLRTDSRVVAMERTHVNKLTQKDFSEQVDFITADLSFISITKAIGTIIDIFTPVEGVILIKPQFEAEPGEQKKGVVRKKEDHRNILARVLAALAEKGVRVLNLDYSPLKGPKGNIEFLLHFSIIMGGPAGDGQNLASLVNCTVESAHMHFGEK